MIVFRKGIKNVTKDEEGEIHLKGTIWFFYLTIVFYLTI